MKFDKQLAEANGFIGKEKLSNFTLFINIAGQVKEQRFDEGDESAYNLFIALDEMNAGSVGIRNDQTGEGKLFILDIEG